MGNMRGVITFPRTAGAWNVSATFSLYLFVLVERFVL
jgi:hypothetical protein